MKNRLLRTVALIALMTSPAVAADLSFKTPQSEPAPASVANWTGFYIGHGGVFAEPTIKDGWGDPV